jgi:DNA end-binding protein Ku
LLLQAMREEGVIGIGSFVLAGKEKLAAVRPKGDGLALETLFVAEDVKSQEEIDEAIQVTSVKKEELQLAEQLISGLLGSFDPEEELTSEYRTSLRALLEAKLEGREIAEPEPAAPEAPVVDLMEALRASVAASKGGKEPESSGRKPAARKRAAAGRK